MKRYFKWSQPVFHFLFSIFLIPLSGNSSWVEMAFHLALTLLTKYRLPRAYIHLRLPTDTPIDCLKSLKSSYLLFGFVLPFTFSPIYPLPPFSFFLMLCFLSDQPTPIPTSSVPHTWANLSSSNPITDSRLAESLFFPHWVSQLSTQR